MAVTNSLPVVETSFYIATIHNFVPNTHTHIISVHSWYIGVTV